MFKQLVIAEYGSTFCSAINVTTSISSVPHQLVTDIRPKSEIYALLGINPGATKVELPDITILTESALPTFTTSRGRSFGPVRMLDFLLAYDVKAFIYDGNKANHNTINYYTIGAEACTAIQYNIGYNPNGSPYISTMGRSSIDIPNMQPFNLTYSNNDTSSALLLNNILVSRMRKLIVDTIDYYQLKQQKYLADNDLLPKYEALQSKVMEFFGIEDQSAVISDLRNQLAKAQQRIADDETTIGDLVDKLTAISSLISKP